MAARFLLLALIGSAGFVHALQPTIEQAIIEIQFCKEVSVLAEAERKAELADLLIDRSKCWAANKWSMEEHASLIASGYKLEMFIPSRYVGRGQQRLEIFVWYADSKGRRRNYWNSCELSDEVKQYVASKPQNSC